MRLKASTAGADFKVLSHHGDKLLYFNGTNEQLSWFKTAPDQPRILSQNSYITLGNPGANMIFGLNYDGTAGSIYKNGGDVTLSAAAVAGAACSTGLTFGKPSWVNDNFNGLVGDFLYFNTVLSAVDRRVVECYLSAKYTIPLAAAAICN